MNRPETKEAARQFINEGGKCEYVYGFVYRGARPSEISKGKALELLEKHHFGMGFYSMSWIGEDVLRFEEYSECDML